MTAPGQVHRRTRRLWIAGGAAAAQLVAAGVLLVQVPSALPEPVVLDIASKSVNAHGDPGRVVVQDTHSLRVLDPSSHQVTATIDTGSSPLRRGVAVRRGTNEALALSENAVVRVDLAAGSVTGSTPLGLASDFRSFVDVLGVDERGNLLVETMDSLQRVRLDDGSVDHVSSERGVVASNGRLWDADYTWLRELVGLSSTGVALSPDEERFYVFTNQPSVVVVDTRTEDVDTIAGRRPIAGKVALPTEDGRHVVTIGGPNSTQVLVRGLNGSDVAAVQATAPIVDMDISPDGTTVYATTGTQLLVVDVRAYT
jgi:hypothetical protein